MEQAASSTLLSNFDKLCIPEEDNKDFTYHDDGPNFIDDADLAYIILLNVFRFLSVKDLLSASHVCKLWNLVASDNIFWKRVNLKNCRVYDINLMVQTLKKYGTEMVDLRKMSIPFVKHVWLHLCESLINIKTLTEINVAGCPASAFTLLVKGMPQLKSLSVSCIIGYILDITPIKGMKDLRALKLVNGTGKQIIFDNLSSEKTHFEELKLKTLTINKVINLSHIEDILPTTLVSLALGEYHSLSNSFHEVILPKLVNLTKLRLEDCCKSGLTNKLLETISTLSNLSELELVNFRISNGFKRPIAKCTNLKSLLIVPIYREHLKEDIETNILVLQGVHNLKVSLQKLVWGVANVHIDQTKKIRDIKSFPPAFRVSSIVGCGDSISVLLSRPGDQNTRLGIMSLGFLHRYSANLWPHLKFKILKVSSSSAWKLSLRNYRMYSNLYS